MAQPRFFIRRKRMAFGKFGIKMAGCIEMGISPPMLYTT
jgi:hypothetical protein